MNDIFSANGHPVFCDGLDDIPILTVENYSKWYSLFVINPDREAIAAGTFEAVELDTFNDSADNDGLEIEFEKLYGEPARFDHAFNPRFVMFIAEKLELEVCYSALEAIIGRWNLEYLNIDYSVLDRKG